MKNKNSNISRHPDGLQVRIQRHGVETTRWFARGGFKSWRATFDAARQWRDEQLAILGAPARDDRRHRGRIWTDGDQWRAWVRSADGRAVATSRSIDRHGSRKARRLVREWLQAHLALRDAADQQ